jgi:uncharacterized protein
MLNLRRAAVGLVAAAAVFAGTPAICADAPVPNAHSLELARKLFSEMHMEQLMGNMVRQMAPAMMEQTRKRNPNLSAADAQVISDAMAASMDDLMKKVTERSIPLYASTFSEKELQDLVNFYDGPTGQAMLAKMPVLMSKIAPMAAELAPEMVTDMTKRICAKTDCSKRTAPASPSD